MIRMARLLGPIISNNIVIEQYVTERKQHQKLRIAPKTPKPQLDWKYINFINVNRTS